MKTKTKLFAMLLAAIFVLSTVFAMAACQPNEPTPPPEEEYEFVFTGSAEIGGRTYNATIYGNRDEEQSISLRIAELPVAELGGEWVYVEGKGYKIYFDDTNSTFIYTKYDTATNEFTFNYNLNVGDTNGGSGKVHFTCKDEAFASVYDGVGLGNVPPTFTGYTTFIGAMVALHEPVVCVLTCYEDGTCTSVSTNEVKYASPLNGTWSYDAEANQYTFTFEPEPFAVNTETGSTYWKFSEEPGAVSLEEASENYTVPPFGEQGYWVQTTITEIGPSTYTTTYDEETNTYWLIFEHGIVQESEFADRYMAYTPED